MSTSVSASFRPAALTSVSELALGLVVGVLLSVLVTGVLARRRARVRSGELAVLRAEAADAEHRRGEAVDGLAVLSAADPVTGLARGADLAEALGAAQANCASVALLHLGLDRFREFNARHGRACGDAVLTEVAHRLRCAVRAADTAARLGGDEFGLLVHDEARAVDVAVRLLAALAEPYEVDAQGPAQLSVSIGIAHAGQDERGEGPGLLAAAEQAMA